MKKLLSAILIACMILAPVTTNAANTTTDINADKSEIESVVQDFFDTYENVSCNKSTQQIIKELTSLSSHDTVQKSKKSDTEKEEESNYIEMAKLLLQRKSIIESASDIDLAEHKKTVEIIYNKTTVQGKRAEVKINVTKTWNYSFSPDIESAAEDDYIIHLTKDEQNWKINSIEGLTDTVMDDAINNMTDEISAQDREIYIQELEKNYGYNLEKQKMNTEKSEANLISPSSGNVSTMVANGYSGGDASRYALDHATNPSSSYHYYKGKDCTNFISQCLYAGGIKQHVGNAYDKNCWYYKTSTNRSSSWTGAPEFYYYINSDVSKIKKSNGSWGTVEIGDIIQTKVDGQIKHSMIISGVAYGSSGRSDLLVCAHSTNRRHVSLNSYYSGTTKVYHRIKGNK